MLTVVLYADPLDFFLISCLSDTSFYTAAPLSLCCNYVSEVFLFASNLIQELIVKGKDRMQFGEYSWWGFVGPLLKLKWHAWLGAAIFLWGSVHQHRCHAILVRNFVIIVGRSYK